MKSSFAALLGMAPLVLVASHVGLLSDASTGTGVLQAQLIDPRSDKDGDLLPDILELVLGTDPLRSDTDGDGVSDFVEVNTGTQPLLPDAPKPLDHAFRLVMAGATERDGPTTRRYLYLYLLYRLPTSDPRDLEGLYPFLDFRGVRIPAIDIIPQSLYQITSKLEKGQGLLACMTFRLVADDYFRTLLPCTFGAYTQIGSKIYASGGILAVRGGALVTMVSYAPGHFVLQPVDDAEVANNSFWNRNRVCTFELEVQATSRGGQICEIKNADCVQVDNFRCVSDCRDQNGGLVFVPDGLSLISGG
jgi:hypothetical protein